MIEIASVRFFTGLGRQEVRVILGAAKRRKLKGGEIVGTADEPATHLYLISSGNIFGVGAFLSQPVGYVGTSKAAHSSEVLMWEHLVIRQLAKAYPRLAENALRTVLRYVALFAERHIALVSKPAQERLAFALTSLGSQTGHIVPSGVEIDVKNVELASLADVSSFTASRLLQEWERKGAVEKSRGKVLIRSPEKLLA